MVKNIIEKDSKFSFWKGQSINLLSSPILGIRLSKGLVAGSTERSDVMTTKMLFRWFSGYLSRIYGRS